eukprot:GHVS01102711.1.p1 GENE.GHVS01102711.1~~GHVS01102711.1.p1  ORF type:complete len:175 (-),score=58.47 GHVS01102711.1:448-972(-)
MCRLEQLWLLPHEHSHPSEFPGYFDETPGTPPPYVIRSGANPPSPPYPDRTYEQLKAGRTSMTGGLSEQTGGGPVEEDVDQFVRRAGESSFDVEQRGDVTGIRPAQKGSSSRAGEEWVGRIEVPRAPTELTGAVEGSWTTIEEKGRRKERGVRSVKGAAAAEMDVYMALDDVQV